MDELDPTASDTFARIRQRLAPKPQARRLGFGALLLAAVFAAVAALLSAAAIIIGPPGIDKGAIPQSTEAVGAVKTPKIHP